MDWKTSVGIALGTWALRNYPKATLVGALALGTYVLLNRRSEKNPFKGEGIVSERYFH